MPNRRLVISTVRGGMSARQELGRLVGAEFVSDEQRSEMRDATFVGAYPSAARALLVRPGSVEQLSDVVAWCYRHDTPMVPRGGATGLAGGAVPILEESVVLSLDRMANVVSLSPQARRICVESGVTTEEAVARAAQAGLLFPPDPGASDRSTIGGNIATNAGGPHTFKYGSTGRWVWDVDVVLAYGKVETFSRADTGMDLRGLVVGSEGTLGVIAQATLALIPAPAARLLVVGLYPSTAAGVEAIRRVLSSGCSPSAVEFLDPTALQFSRSTFPATGLKEGFLLMVEVDGDPDSARSAQARVRCALEDKAATIWTSGSLDTWWRWRANVPASVTQAYGGKLSEDIVVPVEHLADAISQVHAIGHTHGLLACSWGHAGDGNIHATFVLDPNDVTQVNAALDAASDVFALAIGLGGSITGEHGVGSLKVGAVPDQLDPTLQRIQASIKGALDPKGLFNPGKKIRPAPTYDEPRFE